MSESQTAQSQSLPACDFITLLSYLSGMWCRSAPAEINHFRAAPEEADAQERRREERREPKQVGRPRAN